MSCSQLGGLLEAFVNPGPKSDVLALDQEIRRILELPDAVQSLYALVQSPQEADTVRHLAVILLRRIIKKHWNQLDPNFVERLKAVILGMCFLANQNRTLRRACLYLLGTICRILGDLISKWPALFDVLQNVFGSSDSSVEVLRLGLDLYCIIIPTLALPEDKSSPKIEFVLDLIMKSIYACLCDGNRNESQSVTNDYPCAPLQFSAIETISAFIEHFGTHCLVVDFLHKMMPQIFSTIEGALRCRMFEEAFKAFEVFDPIMEMPFPPENMNLLGRSISFAVAVVATSQFPQKIRYKALDTIVWVASHHGSFLIESGLLSHILVAIFAFACEESPKQQNQNQNLANEVADIDDEDDEDDRDDEDDEDDEDDVGLEKDRIQGTVCFVECLAEELPSRIMWKTIFPLVFECSKTSHAQSLKAALSFLGVIVEYCSESMKELNFEFLIQFVLATSFDSSLFQEDVRETAIATLTRFCEYLNPEIGIYHEQILSLLLKYLYTPSEKKENEFSIVIVRNSLMNVVVLIPFLDEEIIGRSFTVLISILGEFLRKRDRALLDASISAIGELALKSKHHFNIQSQLTSSLIEDLKSIMHFTDDFSGFARAAATETLGTIAEIVGKYYFARHLVECMELAFSGLVLDFAFSYELRQQTYSFFGSMVKLYCRQDKCKFKGKHNVNCNTNFYDNNSDADIREVENGFVSNYLSKIVDILLKTVYSTEGVVATKRVRYEREEEAKGYSLASSLTLHEGEDDNDADESNINLRIRTSFLDEKAAACRTLGIIARKVEGNSNDTFCVQYAEVVFKAFLDLINFVYFSVRAEAVFGLESILICVHKYNVNHGKNGEIINMSHFFDTAFPILVSKAINDESREVVINIMEAIEDLLNVFGKEYHQKYLREFVQVALRVFHRMAACQIRGQISQIKVKVNENQNKNKNESESNNEIEIKSENEEKEIELLESVVEVLIAYSKLFVADFAVYFKLLIQYFFNCLHPANNHNIISMGVTAIAECIRHIYPLPLPVNGNPSQLNMKGIFDGCWCLFITLFSTNGGSVGKDSVIRNSLFCVGILFERLPYEGRISMHKQVFEVVSCFGNCNVQEIRDNLSGCLARMIFSSWPDTRPQSQETESFFAFLISSMFPLLSKLIPLENDMDELFPVFQAIRVVFETKKIVASINFAYYDLKKFLNFFCQLICHSEELSFHPGILNRFLAVLKSPHLNQSFSEIPHENQQLLNSWIEHF